MPSIELTDLLAAFVGGVFGAAIGAFPALMLCGLVAVVGSAILYYNGDPTVLTFAFGAFLGPQVVLGGGVAAAAFSARCGYTADGKDVATPLLRTRAPAVLGVGGIFGLLGLVFAGVGLGLAPLLERFVGIDPIALSIVASGVLVRVVFGRQRGGRAPEPDPEVASPDAALPSDAARATWCPPALRQISASLICGGAAAWLGIAAPASTPLVFGVAVLAIGLVWAGLALPILIHVALAAHWAAAATGSILAGLAAGLLAAGLGQWIARRVLLPGDTHLDPPAATLVLLALGLPALGRLSGIPLLGLSVGMATLGVWTILRTASGGKSRRATVNP